MSETANISLDPFLVVVLKGLTDEEPTIVPKSWLCENDSFVMWPPRVASKNTVRTKVTPGDNWLKYEVVQVYWRTATDDFQKATEYLEIAEVTSSEESIEQRFAELQDPKKRKYRHHKYLSTNDDSTQDPRIIIKKVKPESGIQSSINETTNLANRLELSSRVLPEILMNQNSQKPKCDPVDDIDKESNRLFTENEESDRPSTENEEPNLPFTETDGGTGSKTIVKSEQKSNGKKPVVLSDVILRNETIKVLPNNRTVRIPDNAAKFAIENQAQNVAADYAKAGSSRANEYSALKIDGGNKFKPEEFLELPVNEKLNVIGLQQQQIIANQAKLAVAIDVKKSGNETSTKASSLSLDETISMKAFLPVEDLDTFESFDENLRDDSTFRAKVWQFLEPYMSRTNWKDTVRQMIGKVMCNSVQALYSCRGQKGKIPFYKTFFYELIEAATTKGPEKKYRAEEKQILSYVSEYLKYAKTRLAASTNKDLGKGGKKKGSRCNPSKGKSLMSKNEKQRLTLMNNQLVDSEDADDSS